MPLEIPQDFAHVIYSLRYSGDPELQAVTFGVKVDDVAPPTDATVLAELMGDLFDDNIMVNVWAGVTHVGTEVKWQVGAPPIEPVVGSAASAYVGGESSSGVLPPNNAFLVHKRTGIAGHRGRGRCYFPGVPEGFADNNGNVTPSVVTAWNTALENFRDAVIAEASLFGLYLLHSDGISATPDPTFITSMALDGRIATQRRRLRP